jgi:hypothetical protein
MTFSKMSFFHAKAVHRKIQNCASLASPCNQQGTGAKQRLLLLSDLLLGILFDVGDEGGTFLRNVGEMLWVCKALHLM